MYLKINDVDVSSLVGDIGTETQTRKIYGENGGIALDGSTILDILTSKISFSVGTKVLIPTQVKLLYELTRDQSTVEMYDVTRAGRRSFDAEITFTVGTAISEKYYYGTLAIEEV